MLMLRTMLVCSLLGLTWSCGTAPQAASHADSIQSNTNPPSQGRSFIANLQLGSNLYSFLTDNGLTAEPCFQWVRYEDNSGGVEVSPSACPPENALVPKEAVVAKLDVAGGDTGRLYAPVSGATIGTLSLDDNDYWTGITDLCTGSYDSACTLVIQDGSLAGINYPSPPPPPPPPSLPVGTIPAVGAYVTLVGTTNLQNGTVVVGQLPAGGRYKVVGVQGRWVSLQDAKGATEPGWVEASNLQILN